jgi:hypothetical protein
VVTTGQTRHPPMGCVLSVRLLDRVDLLMLGIYQLTKDHGCPVLICSLIISNPAHVTEGIS